MFAAHGVLLTPKAAAVAGPVFDTSALSSLQTGDASPATFTWSHTAAASAYAIVLVNGAVGSIEIVPSAATAVVKFGSTTLTNLGYVLPNNSATVSGGHFLWVFGAASVPSGTQTVSVTLTQSSKQYIGYGSSYTYTNVASVGTLGTAFGSSTTPSLAVTSAAGHTVWGAVSLFASTTLSGSALTARQTGANYFTAGDAAGASTVTVGGTLSGTAPWGVVGLDLV